MNKLHSITKKQSLAVALTISFVLFLNACAAFKKPAAIHDAQVHERALTKEANGVVASVAVVGDREAREIFGIDLSRKKVQAVWVDIKNNTEQALILLPTAIDPDYFAPLEIAYDYHRAFAVDANAALDAHLLDLNFPIRSLIQPGSRASGYIFTNWSRGMKVIDLDILGDDFSQNFTFFAPNPDSVQGQAVIDRMETMLLASEKYPLDSEAELRQALEQLPCCTSNKIGGPSAEPINIVIVGALDDWTTAFVRRGYRYQVLDPRYAFGRAQDVSGRKLSRGYIKAKANAIRVWQTPILYQGKPVWAGQTNTRLGGRFADKAPEEATLPMNPHIDEARDDLTQDLAYSQALIKIGYVKGSGAAQAVQAEASSKGNPYTTDGLRAVLVFGDRPASLEGINFFNWERLADHR